MKYFSKNKSKTFSIEILRLITLVILVISIMVGVYAGWSDATTFGRLSKTVMETILTSTVIVTILWILMTILVFVKRYFFAVIVMALYFIYLPSELMGDVGSIFNISQWCSSIFCITTQLIAVTDLITLALLIALTIWQYILKAKKSD